MLQFADQRQHLGEIRFHRMFAQVTLSRIQDRILTIQNGSEHFCQLEAPLVDC
jgi:hypothetical protein